MKFELGELRDRYDGPDGRTVVMVGESVILLSPVSSEVVRILADGAQNTQSISSRLVDVFGEPGAGLDLQSTVIGVLGELATHEIVRNC